MKEPFKEQKKVSLIFYSEEEGKRALIDRWNIEIGRKYTIGRSKKKVDISINDITISRIQAEFIFYSKDRIMIKDYGSSNGTFINKEKIEPKKVRYFTANDILSIGDEKNELFFEVPKDEIIEEEELEEEEEKKTIRGNGFDEKKFEKENKRNENNNYIKYTNKNYIKNENKIYEKNIKKNKSEPLSHDYSFKRNVKFDKEDKYKDDKDDKYIKFDEEDKYNKDYKFRRYDRNDKKDKYDTYDKKDKYDTYNTYNTYNRYDKYDKYDKNDKFDNYDKYDKYDKYNKNDKYDKDYKDLKNDKDDKDNKYINKAKNYSRSRSNSRRNSFSRKDSNITYTKRYSKSKRGKYNRNSHSSTNSQKIYRNNSWKPGKDRNFQIQRYKKEEERDEDKKTKYKNISSYIIKKDSFQEKEIERENDKRQIALYNEYLLLKKESEENNKKMNLPSLIPFLISKPKDEESYDDDEEDEEDEEDDENDESYKRISYLRPPPRRRLSLPNSFGRRLIGIKRRGGYLPRFSGRLITTNFY